MWAGEPGPSFREKGSPLLFFRYEAGAQPSLPWYLGGGGRMLVRLLCQAHGKQPHAYCESHFRAQMAGTKGRKCPGPEAGTLLAASWQSLSPQSSAFKTFPTWPLRASQQPPCPTHPTRPAASQTRFQLPCPPVPPRSWETLSLQSPFPRPSLLLFPSSA